MNIESLRREIEELKKFNKHSYSSLTAGVYHILLHLGLTKEADELIKDLPVDVQEKIKNHLKN